MHNILYTYIENVIKTKTSQDYTTHLQNNLKVYKDYYKISRALAIIFKQF